MFRRPTWDVRLELSFYVKKIGTHSKLIVDFTSINPQAKREHVEGSPITSEKRG